MPNKIYAAFGLDSSTSSIFQAGSSPTLRFTFNEVTYVDIVKFKYCGNGNVYCDYQLQASYDGSTWFNVGNKVYATVETFTPTQVEIHAPIKAFRFKTTSHGNVGVGYQSVMAYKYN